LILTQFEEHLKELSEMLIEQCQAQIPLDEAKAINFQNIKFPLDQFDDGTSLVAG
jgi:hypothetical protein